MNVFSPLRTRWLPSAALGVTLAGLSALLWPAYGGAGLLAASLASLPLILWGLRLAAAEQSLRLRGTLLRPANMISLARLGLGVLAGLLGGLFGGPAGGPPGSLSAGLSASYGAEGLGPFAAPIAVLVCLSFIMDGLDGQAARLEARKAAQSGLSTADLAARRAVGAWLDMETDSLLFFLYSLLLVARTRVPALFLSVGLFRYAFGVLFSLPPWTLRVRPLFSWTAKTIAAVAEFCLCALFLLEARLIGILPGASGAADPGMAASSPWTQRLWPMFAYLPVALLAFSFTLEGVLRLRELSALGSAKHLAGLFHSFVVYQCIPGRQARLRRMSAKFLKPGDLAVDVGAHLGNRVRAWRSMGVRVVAVEPQPSCAAALSNWFGSDPGVTLIRAALGAYPGEAKLRVSQAHPTLSSVSGDWVDRMSRHRDFDGIDWDAAYTVPVLTLDQLIADHGLPAFVKIDVEGFEPQVLAGLSRRVPALSFEFLPQSLEGAYDCLERMEALGKYEYNASMVETLRFVFESWVSAEELRRFISGGGPGGRSGDVYARLSGL